MASFDLWSSPPPPPPNYKSQNRRSQSMRASVSMGPVVGFHPHQRTDTGWRHLSKTASGMLVIQPQRSHYSLEISDSLNTSQTIDPYRSPVKKTKFNLPTTAESSHCLTFTNETALQREPFSPSDSARLMNKSETSSDKSSGSLFSKKLERFQARARLQDSYSRKRSVAIGVGVYYIYIHFIYSVIFKPLKLIIFFLLLLYLFCS